MNTKKHTIRYGSVCSGVEAATLAWRPLGWEAAFFAEVEPFPCAVLQQRLNATPPKRPLNASETSDDKDRKMREAWAKAISRMREAWAKITRKEPPIPNLGDFTKIQQGDYNGTIDVLVGGTPCQDLSIAGKREGFAGSRSCLALDFIRLAYQSGPVPWIVWENVPGALSANSGHDFATFLSLLSGCEITPPDKGFGTAGFVCNARRDRYGLAWRVLDAQFTRVSGFPYAIPQRRRRLFVIGHFGDWESAAEVLLEPQCMSWPAPTRRKTRKAVAGSPGGCVEDASAIRMRSGCEGGGKGALVGRELSHTLATGNDKMIVTIGLGRDVIKSGENSKFSFSIIENAQPTLTARGEGGVCIKNNAVFDTVISLASGQGGEWGCLGVNVAQTLSLNNGGFHYIACYENHANDSRVTFSGSVCPALTSRAGTGGGNLPLVMSSSELCFDVGNGQVDCSMHPLYECATTLHCMHDANAVMRVPINSMIIGKDVTLTDRQTIGIGEDGDALPTIGAKHHHAVAVASFVGRQGAKAGGIGYAEEVTPTVRASQDIHIVVASFMGGQGGQEGSICFSDELAPTIKASPSLVPDIVVSSFAIAETVIGRETKNGGNGVGAKYEVAYTLDTAGVQGVAVDVVDKQGQFMSDVVPCLTATSFKEAPSILPHLDTNLVEEIKNVKIEKTSPSEVLRILRKTFGEKAFSEWIRRHACFFEEKILQQNMHGSSVRCSSVNVEKNEHMSLPCEKNCPAREMRNLWQGECIGRSSQGQEFSEQRSAESRSDLSELSQQDSSCKKDLCRMWQTAKGAWILREAFGALQEIRQSFTIQTESIRLNSFGYVRRLIPIETERLMGFPDGWTKIPWNGRSEEHCPDAPRYKACGNSMCVNVMRWIGEQIQRVEDENRNNRPEDGNR